MGDADAEELRVADGHHPGSGGRGPAPACGRAHLHHAVPARV